MTARAQKTLAIAGALALAALVIWANAHLLAVSLRSQPACAQVASATPAKRAC